MKRRWVLLVVLGLTFALAAPAGGNGKPDCSDPTSHPSCGKVEYAEGSSCIEAVLEKSWGVGEVDTALGDFSFSWNSSSWEDSSLRKCIDVGDAGAPVAGDWRIDVTVADGTVRELLIILRDSVAPGDACWDEGIRERQISDGFSRTYIKFSPLSGGEACGMEFTDDLQDPDPFAFLVFAWAKGKSKPMVTVTVDVPPLATTGSS